MKTCTLEELKLAQATPSTPAPDYGEPWELKEFPNDNVYDRNNRCVAEFLSANTADRIIACTNALSGIPDPAAFVAEAKEMMGLLKNAEAALLMLLAESQQNSCRHEETHRGGAIWEICSSCGAKWADDKGGKPKYKEPKSWGIAHDVITKLQPFLL